jgi:SAM-dependent methyltransferase
MELVMRIEETPLKHRDKGCPFCSNTHTLEIAQRDRYGFKVSSLLCRDCGLIYLNPRLGIEEYGDFYTNEYRKLVSNYWRRPINADMDCEEYGEALVQFLENYFASFSGLKTMDIGGSSGGVATVLKDRLGLEITVCDPNKAELQKAIDRGLAGIWGSIEDLGLHGEWEMVLMCRTVDHLFDPVKTLNLCWDMLVPDGWMYVDMVDWLCVARSEGIVNSFHLDHPFNFTEKSFLGMLKHCGFEVVAEHISPEELGPNSGRIEHGFLCKKAQPVSGHPIIDTDELVGEIRKIQAEERREVLGATLKKQNPSK